jgi:diacylglycerol kinase (ATP)
LTIIDIDKPYTDDVHFHDLSARDTPASEGTPERKLSSVDLEIDASSSEGSNISDDFSLMSEIIDAKPGDHEESACIGHIDSPEVSETTYVNSETLHGESIMDDISSMLGQDVLMAMMGKNGENETYTDDTTLFTSDTVSDIAMDSRNPSLEKNNDAKLKYISKVKKAKESEVEKFGFENRVFYIENATKVEEQIKYCSLAHFEEGNDIARKSFKKPMKKSIKKRADESNMKHLLSASEEPFRDDQSPKQKSLSPKKLPVHKDDDKISSKNSTPAFPQVSVVVEPPSPSHSEDKKSLKNSSRMASVLSDIFDQGTDTLSVHSPEPSLGTTRERRCSDNPKLLGSDPEYGKFLSCSPAATRRISCGSLFKPGEPDK